MRAVKGGFGKFSRCSYERPEDFKGELGSTERSEWAFGQKATIELTHNWGTEDDEAFKYHNGNSEPRGFGG